MRSRRLAVKTERLRVRQDGSLRLAVVSDTHSALHPRALPLLTELQPQSILHAGDVGDLQVLGQLATVCPVIAVRGNVDARLPDLPDVRTVEIDSGQQLLTRILLLHVGLYGPKLRAEAIRLAQSESASIVVCGHSHVPFIGTDRGLTVFNPGAIGPRRFPLPIVFGLIDVAPSGIRMSHVDCETGQRWLPP